MSRRPRTRSVRRNIFLSAVGLWAFVCTTDSAAQPDTSLQTSENLVVPRLRALEDAQSILVTQMREMEQQIADLRRALSLARPASPPSPPLPAESIVLATVPLRGERGARVGIIEYSDFQCPYCGAFARETLPALEERYIAKGLVRFGFWNLPLSEIHPQAVNGAEAAACAGRQGKFWDMHDALFADQHHLDLSSLVARARRLELDLAAFGECMQHDGAAKVREELAAARALRIAVTPTFIVGTILADGTLKPRHMLVGARELSAFAAVIDPLLAEIVAAPSTTVKP